MTTGTLYGRTRSINVRKVCWTLDELGLAHERVDRGGGEADVRMPDYLALNPNGLIPTWCDDDVTLWESNAICRYLARKTGRDDLFPADPVKAGPIDQWMDWASTTLNMAWRYAFMALVRKKVGFDDANETKRSVAHWNEVMTVLDERLAATGAHVAGEAFTLGDVPAGLAVHRWLHSPIDRVSLPAVESYYGRLQERAAFRPWARADVP